MKSNIHTWDNNLKDKVVSVYMCQDHYNYSNVKAELERVRLVITKETPHQLWQNCTLGIWKNPIECERLSALFRFNYIILLSKTNRRICSHFLPPNKNIDLSHVTRPAGQFSCLLHHQALSSSCGVYTHEQSMEEISHRVFFTLYIFCELITFLWVNLYRSCFYSATIKAELVSRAVSCLLK